MSRLSFCHVVAAVQVALALGSLALGHPGVAAAFAMFAVVQIASLVVQRCGWGGDACETRLVQPLTAGRPGSLPPRS